MKNYLVRVSVATTQREEPPFVDAKPEFGIDLLLSEDWVNMPLEQLLQMYFEPLAMQLQMEAQARSGDLVGGIA